MPGCSLNLHSRNRYWLFIIVLIGPIGRHAFIWTTLKLTEAFGVSETWSSGNQHD